MTDEKRKPEEDEVTEEQLRDVSGGATSHTMPQEVTTIKQVDKASTPLMDTAIDGNSPGTAEIDFMRTTDEDED